MSWTQDKIPFPSKPRKQRKREYDVHVSTWPTMNDPRYGRRKRAVKPVRIPFEEEQ